MSHDAWVFDQHRGPKKVDNLLQIVDSAKQASAINLLLGLGMHLNLILLLYKFLS
jgi:hypothetical protein